MLGTDGGGILVVLRLLLFLAAIGDTHYYRPLGKMGICYNNLISISSRYKIPIVLTV